MIPISHATRRMLREVDAYKKSPEYLRVVLEEIQREARERQDREDSMILPVKVLSDFPVNLETEEMRILRSFAANLKIKSIFEDQPLRLRSYFRFEECFDK